MEEDPRTVRSYADLEPSLLGRVEELIDFVTAPAPDGPRQPVLARPAASVSAATSVLA